MDVTFRIIRPRPGADRTAVLALLAEDDLDLDKDVERIVTAVDADGRLVACAGLAGDVVKCVAIHKSARGEGLALPLMTEVVALAWEMGRKNLFLYTKPDNEALFKGCGFISLACVPGKAVLMENNKHRLADYCASLAGQRKPGAAVTGLVMNCNPFTLGHRYLVEEASKRTDWVHLFVVREDLSLFPYEDRLDLVRKGVADIANVTVHPGSVYIISRATFPAYFLKNAAVVDKAYTGIDIQIFRKYIAPALGITHRFAGSEPHSAVTSQYNEDMAFWLATPEVAAPPIAFAILPRKELDGEAISASRVRAAWRDNGIEAVRPMVPVSTYAYLESHPDLVKAYSPDRNPGENVL
jgi:[citrate (pro-3S)-lyase] ligase